MLECPLDGHTSENTLIPHIREKHGGLKRFLNLFVGVPVCTNELMTAVENLTWFSYADDTPGLKEITAEERELILVSRKNNMPVRSVILETPDF